MKEINIKKKVPGKYLYKAFIHQKETGDFIASLLVEYDDSGDLESSIATWLREWPLCKEKGGRDFGVNSRWLSGGLDDIVS